MSDIKTAIENLYLTFEKYTTEGIEHCDCGCIDENDVKKLNSKPLRDLTEDDLVIYHGKSLYTWGEIEHYKHYLPRILELISINRNFSFIDLYEFYVKLDYAKWTEWDADEIKVIKDYVLMDWVELANNKKSEINDTVLQAYCKFFELEELVKLWDISNSSVGLRNFTLFFYYHGNQILDNRFKMNETTQENIFIPLIRSSNLIERLETDFFKYEQTEPEYAEKISITLQMIEQQLKTDKIKDR